MWWTLAACAVPDLQGGLWEVHGVLPGDCFSVPTECPPDPECPGLIMEVSEDGAVSWPRDCDRTDLPTVLNPAKDDVVRGRVYDLTGGEGSNATWWLRESYQPGLFEVWLFDLGTYIPDTKTFGAEGVLELWDASDTLQPKP